MEKQKGDQKRKKWPNLGKCVTSSNCVIINAFSTKWPRWSKSIDVSGLLVSFWNWC